MIIQSNYLTTSEMTKNCTATGEKAEVLSVFYFSFFLLLGPVLSPSMFLSLLTDLEVSGISRHRGRPTYIVLKSTDHT